MTHVDPASPATDRIAPPATLEALSDALEAEKKLIDELIAVILSQRAAVSVEDLQAVDDSVFATHRLLLTLGEARRRRRTINQLLGFQEDLAVRELEARLGSQMTPRLRTGRDELRDAAHRLSHEIDINRRVLRQALANSETYVRAIRGVPPDVTPMYGTGGAPTYTSNHSASFSRTV